MSSSRDLPNAEVLTTETGVFDINVVADFSRNYLSTYYCEPPTADEQAVLSFLIRHYPRISGQPCAIEIGCGPTVHHVLPLAPFVSEIHMADYLPDNLQQVQRWRDEAPDAHSWHHYTSLTLKFEGRDHSEAEILQRERETKGKISSLLPCDLKSDSPLGTARQYAAVASFYCAENIGITKDEWFKVMKRLANLTAPGGYLFLSALGETNFYVVKSPDGREHSLPSFYLTEQDFREVLPELGFNKRETVVESKKLRGQEREGVNGVILVAALKA
jgi:nicotinamide N-methyltransferase